MPVYLPREQKGGLSFNVVLIAIGAADALRKMWPFGSAWRCRMEMEEHGLIPTAPSMKIFKRAIRFHQFLEPPSHGKGDRLDWSIENFPWFLTVERLDLRRRNKLGAHLSA